MCKKWQILVIVWVLFGSANLLRAGIASRLAGTLETYALAIPLPFLAWLYTGWGAAFLINAMLTWQRRAPDWAVPPALAYQATLWGLRLFAYRADYARAFWARDALLSGVFILAVAWLAHEKPSQRMKRMSDEA